MAKAKQKISPKKAQKIVQKKSVQKKTVQKIAQKKKPKASLKANLGAKKKLQPKGNSKVQGKSKAQAKPKVLAKSKVQDKSKVATKSKMGVKQKAEAKIQGGSNLLTPLDDRILVKPLTLANRTPGGLIIPDTVELEKPSSAVVVSVGRGHLNKKGDLRPMDVKPGDTVLFAHYSAQKIEIQGEEYLLLRESDVLGIQV